MAEQNDATPVSEAEPVATVVWYDPNLDPLAMTPRRIVDPTAKFISGATLGTKLYALAKPASEPAGGGES